MEEGRCPRKLVQGFQPQEQVSQTTPRRVTVITSHHSVMTFPYPDTSYCSPPQEDKTNEPLCRPIPASSRFPGLPTVAATPAVRAAPPGSAGWVTQKSAPVQSRKASTRGTRGRGTPASLHIQPSSRGGQAGAGKSASAVSSDAGSRSPCKPLY